ncbi:RecA-superfamily ATPase possibly involved in signal transduction [Synechococcus sp. PCC 7502]|uniref:circadian clock protein KaiC n=1 Tax=Synechococcus sp. PCC 7502 TaxID=1173263 RepID=UPI00029FA10F|nr:circadian clock protein KaiC [Synechococcus sp. PCC 7502]AFY73307.1 RecA-superfamily ATPase possibly involved in signal transduction [Synechococcus sp. PCC 7502]
MLKIINNLKPQLPKCLTGIHGLDEITGGGLPQGRPTLVCGSAGCGKTLLGVEFLVHGAVDYGEAGVLMTFEETAEEITQNVASLGWELDQLVTDGKLIIDHVYINPLGIEETGEYDLEGLFIRLGSAIAEIGAKRVVLDTIEVLFAGLHNTNIVRAEIRRLFGWLKQQGVTAIITGERGENTLTRQGLEEYVSDCVIRLEQRTVAEISTRYLQIFKYRGTRHGVNEYPFLIEENGIFVAPITSLKLDHDISTEQISTGIPRLDTMLDGGGYYRGSSILVTGMAGTGKTTLAGYFASSTCDRGERCLYLATEEAPQQILRNQRSIGLDLNHYIDSGLLRLEAVRPTAYGLEMRLIKILAWVNEFQPTAVVIDPMSNLATTETHNQTKNFLMRLIDLFKAQQITVFFTNLLQSGNLGESIEVNISSLMDTWLELRTIETNGERNRTLSILKSRGMNHSNQVREFLVTSEGVELVDVYLGAHGFLTGTARAAQQAQEKSDKLSQQQEFERKKRRFDYQQAFIRAQIAALEVQLATEREELDMSNRQEKVNQQILFDDRDSMAELRNAD